MAAPRLNKIQFYFRKETKHAALWEKRLRAVVQKHYPGVRILESNILPKTKKAAPQLLVVLGGDGTIIEATQRFQRWAPLIFGLNLGNVGFLTSIRDKKRFPDAIRRVLAGKYHAVPHMLIRASVMRRNKTIYSSYSLNDVTVQNLFGLVRLRVEVEGHPIQYIHGTGVLVATATGSTAYNLSAHGPIVMPDIKCLIVTELMDHNVPTPSLIVKRNRSVEIFVEDFRKNELFAIKKTGEPVDVIFAAALDRVIPLQKGDRIIVKKSERLARFVELDTHYFFKSLREKFAFR